ncbi:intraflagellar transport protein 20 homolog [Chrysoperla carnea]|uniref:intraflagellar transport protein 20 homolog n=1 Tax=Chrysoperla carnea TaxID=189513 RepID=UPI001D077893|nr:intraflagellar transport protein 20 homolog [Chrysoperla carnea]
MKSGIYFDELNKIRVIDPKLADQSTKLKDECKNFIEKLDNFQTLTDKFIKIMDSLASEVENEKLCAIGRRNMVQSMTKQNELEKNQLQALLMEKSLELERLRIEHHSMQKTMSEQQDVLDRLTYYS